MARISYLKGYQTSLIKINHTDFSSLAHTVQDHVMDEIILIWFANNDNVIKYLKEMYIVNYEYCPVCSRRFRRLRLPGYVGNRHTA